MLMSRHCSVLLCLFKPMSRHDVATMKSCQGTLHMMSRHWLVNVATLLFLLQIIVFVAFLLIFAFFLNFLKNINLGEDSIISH